MAAESLTVVPVDATAAGIDDARSARGDRTSAGGGSAGIAVACTRAAWSRRPIGVTAVRRSGARYGADLAARDLTVLSGPIRRRRTRPNAV